ncbi:hypothetical protein CTI12_AA403410 [Artemisia annua]|uniref:Transmembrane protein n=1 Tax=Artemisia annua TaxID=35608 RepID=A0A2U1L0V7_ARTAN|nr:hypothetical protein CTI12_AA482450 [Artemisia annua]PWA58178.1 hypothetical protein CTI12_AA403410 [Artemisia annua]
MAIRYYFIANVLLLLTSLSVSIVARPIGVVKSVGYVNHEIKSDHMDLFSLAAIKTGGCQSEVGMRHEFPTFESFGNIKNSVPSPGVKGHEFKNDNILGDMKNSGPSSGGKGHEFPSSVESLGNLKNSGPSSGGKGH